MICKNHYTPFLQWNQVSRLFLRLFFRESYPFTTEKVYLSQIPGLVNMALYVSPIVSGEVVMLPTY